MKHGWLHILWTLSDFDKYRMVPNKSVVDFIWSYEMLWGHFRGEYLVDMSRLRIMQWCHWSLCWHSSVGVCNFLLLAIQLNIRILYLWITIWANLPREVTVDLIARLRQIPNKNGCWISCLTVNSDSYWIIIGGIALMVKLKRIQYGWLLVYDSHLSEETSHCKVYSDSYTES